ncbi:phosphatase PAP2 family protein [Cryptosporangium sp. NPDC051539]|uniref:phosphatase PAP2 family protein n=1 Tax=Cryptosporangium sp. NPDC051539 TaxID=3363962 RepID=UPI0037965312
MACAAAVPVALLAIVVKHVDGPVARLDLAVADGLNRFAVDHRGFVDALDVISTVGHPATFRLGATVAALWLLAVDRPRLALWTLVTTWGGALLGVVLKVVVTRARPVLPDAVAHADGYSFPSGHALGACVGSAVLLLLWLDLARPDRKAFGWAAAGLVTAIVCFSRIGLGVHYLSDVVGGCLVGLGWTAATTIVFQLWRRDAGLAPVDVVSTGLEPERAEPDDDPRPLPQWWGSLTEAGRLLPRIVPFWIGLVAVTAGIGELLVRFVPDDTGLNRWFADHRAPLFDDLTAFGSLIGETGTITVITVASWLAARLMYRRWLEPTVLLFAVLGEVWGFVLVTALVDRPRPPVPHLDLAPPTSSFPSGHTAATVCCYGALAVLVGGGRRAWYLGGVAVLAAVVGLSRVYRGMHHPSDVLAGAAYGAVWLTIVVVILLHRSPGPDRFAVRKVRSPRRK